MAKAIAEQFTKHNRTEFAAQVASLKSINVKDVMPSANEMLKPITVPTMDDPSSAFSSGNEND